MLHFSNNIVWIPVFVSRSKCQEALDCPERAKRFQGELPRPYFPNLWPRQAQHLYKHALNVIRNLCCCKQTLSEGPQGRRQKIFQGGGGQRKKDQKLAEITEK